MEFISLFIYLSPLFQTSGNGWCIRWWFVLTNYCLDHDQTWLSERDSNGEEIPLLLEGWSDSGGSLVVAFVLVNLQDLHMLYLTMNFIILLSDMLSKPPGIQLGICFVAINCLFLSFFLSFFFFIYFFCLSHIWSSPHHYFMCDQEAWWVRVWR